jgi:hypothetical protein
LHNALKELGIAKYLSTGTYVQTHGPRFETPAEIRALATLGGTIVGMTCAHEATLAKEIKLPYAVVCMVDNMANGVAAEEKLSFEGFKEAVRQNKALVEDLATKLVKKFSHYSPENDARAKVDLLVHAKYIVPIVPDVVYHDHCLVVSKGAILDILPSADASKKYRGSENIRLHHVPCSFCLFDF